MQCLEERHISVQYRREDRYWTEHSELWQQSIDALVELNLFQFNSDARFQPGDPEFGRPEVKVGGEEVDARFGAIASRERG